MSAAPALAPAATSETMTRCETPYLHVVSPQGSSAPVARQTGFWATLRRASRRVGRWLAKAAGWLSSPKGRICLTIAGEGLVVAGALSRATMSDTLDAVSLAATPFAPSRREGPRVMWG